MNRLKEEDEKPKGVAKTFQGRVEYDNIAAGKAPQKPKKPNLSVALKGQKRVSGPQQHTKSDSVESGNRPVTADSGLDRHKAYLKGRGELDTSVHKQGSSTVGKGSDRKSKVMKAIRKMSPERQRNFSTKGIADYLSKD